MYYHYSVEVSNILDYTSLLISIAFSILALSLIGIYILGDRNFKIFEKFRYRMLIILIAFVVSPVLVFVINEMTLKCERQTMQLSTMKGELQSRFGLINKANSEIDYDSYQYSFISGRDTVRIRSYNNYTEQMNEGDFVDVFRCVGLLNIEYFSLEAD